MENRQSIENEGRNMSYRDALLADNPGKTLVWAHEVLTLPGMESIRNTVSGVNVYNQRVFPLAREGDFVMVNGPYDEDYFEYCLSNGFGTSKVVQLSATPTEGSIHELVRDNIGDLSEVKALDSGVLVPYYSGEPERHTAEALGLDLYGHPEEITLAYYDKGEFKSICLDLGLESPDGSLFSKEQHDETYLNQLVDIQLATSETGRVFIKGATGASGSSLYTVNPGNKTSILHKIMNEDPDREFLVETEYDVVSSPNSQWFIRNNGEVLHLGSAKQLFAKGENNNFVHDGNITGDIPHYSALLSKASRIGEQMAKDGYRGIFGLDFIITAEGRVMPVENNARVNGSTYGWEILKELRSRHSTLSEARFVNVVTQPLTFEEMEDRAGDLMYHGSLDGEATVFPLNPGPLPAGKFSVAVCGETAGAVQSAYDNWLELFPAK